MYFYFFRATLPLTNEATSTPHNDQHAAPNVYDRHLSQCIKLKQEYLHSQSTSSHHSVNKHLNGCQKKESTSMCRDSSKTSLSSVDHACSRMVSYGNDIIFADQAGSEIIVSDKKSNSISSCNCSKCNESKQHRTEMLSDLQQSVSKKCLCTECSKENTLNSQSANNNNQQESSGIIFCDYCKKQKISLSNFRALQIANRLHLADGAKSSASSQRNANFDDDLCKRIDLSLNMDSEIDMRMKNAYSITALQSTQESDKTSIKTHVRHSSDTVFNHNRNQSNKGNGGIDLSQFCICELSESNVEVRRKTSSVDEIFSHSSAEVTTSRNSNPIEIGRSRERLEGGGSRQRSLSDSQRDKAKTENKSNNYTIWLRSVF